jgi:hypothetical protein
LLRVSSLDRHGTVIAEDGDVSSPKEQLLNYLCDAANFSAMLLVNKLLVLVPTIFDLVQGGSSWTTTLRDATGMVRTAHSSITELLTLLRALHNADERVTVLDEVMVECEQQQEENLRRSVDHDELAETELPNSRAANAVNRAAARNALDTTLRKALATMENSAAMQKLTDVMSDLAVIDRCGLDTLPLELPVNADEMWQFFCITAESGERSFTLGVQLRSQWGAHRAAWKKPAAGAPPLTRGKIFEYWSKLSAQSPELASVVLRNISRPVSSSSVERVFSYLTQMDTSTRQSMGRETLHDLLFVRANWQVVHAMQEEMAAELTSAEHGLSHERSDERERKRKRVAADALDEVRSGGRREKEGDEGEAELSDF